MSLPGSPDSFDEVEAQRDEDLFRPLSRPPPDFDEMDSSGTESDEEELHGWWAHFRQWMLKVTVSLWLSDFNCTPLTNLADADFSG